jgi:hypothetical protein
MREVEKSLGKPVFNWAGKDYPCCPNEATASKILGLGGFGLSADLLLFVRKAVLPEVGPQEKQTIVFLKKKYRIDKLGVLPGGEVITLICNDASEGG